MDKMPLRGKTSQFMEKSTIKHIRTNCNAGMYVTGEAGLITGRLKYLGLNVCF
jgi:hypothetical protein